MLLATVKNYDFTGLYYVHYSGNIAVPAELELGTSKFYHLRSGLVGVRHIVVIGIELRTNPEEYTAVECIFRASRVCGSELWTRAIPFTRLPRDIVICALWRMNSGSIISCLWRLRYQFCSVMFKLACINRESKQ